MPIEFEACEDGGSVDDLRDVEPLLLCDVDEDGNLVGTALAVYTYNADGTPDGPPTFVDPITGDPYVAVGTLQPCGDAVTVQKQLLCDILDDNSSVQFERHFIYNDGRLVDTRDTTIDGVPYGVTGTVQSCDPSAVCVPSPNINLNADCGPGEDVDEDIVAEEGDVTNSVVSQDPSADALCGGTWNRPDEEAGAPFPVEEDLRGTTYDGNVTEFGSAGLTAADGIDADGAGWLRLNGNGRFDNGGVQFLDTFPSTQGVTVEFDYASYGGTNPGGDGFWFALSDGAAPAQAAGVGGGGGLGLGGLSGGYLAITLDEFGGSGPPGGGSFNRLKIHALPPAGRAGGVGQLADAPVAPNTINQHPRTSSPKVRLSVFVDNGRVFVSAGIRWPGATDFTTYFDRLDVTGQLNPPPATFRMNFNGASGGAFQSIHEIRGLSAIPAGQQRWRAFPVTLDTPDDCVTEVLIDAHVDVTVQSDSSEEGNPDNEVWFWLVNTATGEVIDRAEFSSNPNTVGDTRTLDLGPLTVAPADVANLRVYVGAETRDESGAYSYTWEDLRINAQGVGCPAEQVRTIPISAPCPIDVRIIGGSGDAPAPVTVVNTPANFEDAAVCMIIGGQRQGGFRRETRDAEGNNTVIFLGANGTAVEPESWEPGPCVPSDADRERFCYTLTSTGSDVNLGWARHDDGMTPSPQIVNGIAFFDALGNPIDPNADGFLQVNCSGGSNDTELIPGCDATPGGAFVPFVWRITYDDAGEVVSSRTEGPDGQPYAITGAATTGYCPTNRIEQEVLCDQNGPFIRLYFWALDTLTATADRTLAGDPYTSVGTVEVCGGAGGENVTVDDELACDIQPDGTVVQFWRRIIRATDGTITTSNVDHDGNPYTVTGAIGSCEVGADSDFDDECVIDVEPDGTRTMVWRRVVRDEDGVFTASLVDAVGAAYTQQGTLSPCSEDANVDRETACWTTTAGGDTVFTGTIRHDDRLPAPGWQLFDQNQTPVPATTPGLTFVDCSTCCPQVIGNGCWDDGTDTGTWTSIREADGTVNLLDSVTGDPVDEADVVPCGAPVNQSTLVNVPENDVYAVTQAGLVSWSVRVITTPVSVSLNGGAAVPLVAGEVTSFAAEDGTTLDDDVSVIVGAGGQAHVGVVSRT